MDPTSFHGFPPKVGTFADVVIADAIIKNISGAFQTKNDAPQSAKHGTIWNHLLGLGLGLGLMTSA